MRILLIQQPIRSLKRALACQGYLVEACDFREKAANKARVADLIVLDLDTAGPDAPTRLKRWRMSGVAAPVLVLAAPDTPGAKVAALDSGADAFVVKPYDRDELLAQVRAMLRRVPAKEHTRIQILDLELSLAERLARRAGRTINLTRREYDLLYLLASDPGRVFTRAEIWAHLSGRDEKSNSNLIDVYIRYLRKKIDNDFQVPLILTSWGHGYRLRAEADLETAC